MACTQMWASQEWDEYVVQETGRIRSAFIWCDAGPHFRCYELVHYLHSAASPRFHIELHFHAEHHGKSLADSWFSIVSRALHYHSLRPESKQLSTEDLRDALFTVLGEFRENKRLRMNDDEEGTWDYTIKEYVRNKDEPRQAITPKVAFIRSVYYLSFPVTKERILYRLPGETKDREVEVKGAREQRPSASLQGFPTLVPSAARSSDSSVRNPLAAHAERLKRVESIRSGQRNARAGVPRRAYLCRKCGQPKKGHTCTAVAASSEAPRQLETNEARRISDPEPSAQLPDPPAAAAPQRASRVRSRSQSQSASDSPTQGIDARTNTNNLTSVITQSTQQPRAQARRARAVARSVNTDQQRTAPQNENGLLSRVTSAFRSLF
jgi:hypothetical protein